MSFWVYLFDINFNFYLTAFLYSGSSKGAELTEEICMLKGELLDCFTGCDLGSSAMVVSHWRGQELGSCSIYKAGCPSGPNMELKAWNIPREMLSFDLHWNPKDTVLTSMKGSHWQVLFTI